MLHARGIVKMLPPTVTKFATHGRFLVFAVITNIAMAATGGPPNL